MNPDTSPFLPSQVEHIRKNIGQIKSTGLRGIEENWNVPVALWRSPNGFEAEYPSDSHATITVLFGGAPFERRSGKFAGHVTGPYPDQTVLYSGSGPRSWASRGDSIFAHIYLQRSFLARIASYEGLHDANGLELRDDRIFVRDPRLRVLADTYIQRSVDHSVPASALEMDAMAILLGLHLVRHHSNIGIRRVAPLHGLDSRRMARVIEFMNSHAKSRIKLAEIAGIAGLSQHHFCSAFTRSMGISPHQYLIQCRIEQAKLLLRGAAPLVDIALECGFSSQSHFTTVFREATGVTPAVWRRASAGGPMLRSNIMKSRAQ